MFEIFKNDDGTIRLSGRLDASHADEADAVFSVLPGGGIVDLSDLEYISSTGITVLLRAWKRADDAGETLRVINPSPTVRTVFRYAGLEHVFAVA